jgi:hypothetical protein
VVLVALCHPKIDHGPAGPASDPYDPDCAPNVGTIALTDFIAMHPSDRAAARQQDVDAIRTSTITAGIYGIAVPVGLLVIGVMLGTHNGLAR